MKVSNKVLAGVKALLAGTATEEEKALVQKWVDEGMAKRAEMAKGKEEAE